MPKKYRSDVMRVIHGTATDLYKIGGMDRNTLRKFDVLCFTSMQEMTPKKFAPVDPQESE